MEKTKKKPRPAAQKYDRAAVSKLVLYGMDTGRLSANKACAAAGVSLHTFLHWVDDDEKLAKSYARARESWIDNMAQEIQEIADAKLPLDNFGKIDNSAVQKQKLQIDTRKWLLSKIAPKKYGDKVEVDHTGTVKIDAITRKVVDPMSPLTIDQKLTERVIKGLKNDSEDEENDNENE